MAVQKVGLALGSGAARGMAHIGVLEVLEKAEIPIHLVAGTSSGAAVGALFAEGKRAREIKKTALELSWRHLAPLIDLTVPRAGLISGRKISDWMKLISGGNLRFSDLKLPFACVATDIITGEEVVIDEGPLVEAIRASISIPGIFAPLKWRGRYLVDGVLVNPVPVSVLKKMGADLTIAVNVIPRTVDIAHHVDRNGNIKAPNILSILIQSTFINSYSLVVACLENADIVIEPHVDHFGFGDFHHTRELIKQGRLAARAALPEIKRRLSTKSSKSR